jgi:hypothetical protein
LHRFFSILFLRAAKLHSAFGGGSMSLLPLVPGRPASGTKKVRERAGGGPACCCAGPACVCPLCHTNQHSRVPINIDTPHQPTNQPTNQSNQGLDLSKYQTLTEQQKGKLQDVLEKRKVWLLCVL